MVHQTDSDGNWAGGKRESRDSLWNIDLAGLSFEHESVSRAPYQLIHHKDGSYNLHSFSGIDNDFSEEELAFIKKFIPTNAQCSAELFVS